MPSCLLLEGGSPVHPAQPKPSRSLSQGVQNLEAITGPSGTGLWALGVPISGAEA